MAWVLVTGEDMALYEDAFALVRPAGHAMAAVRGLEAGLHAFVECDAQVSIEPLMQHCLRQGIVLTDISRFYVGQPTQRGVVLGYGGLALEEIAWVGRQIVAQVRTTGQGA